MKRFQKIYLEISNICNLNCHFCPGTNRSPQIMDEENFASLMPKLRPWTDYLYFHIMGEPLCHPNLQRYLSIAGEYGFKVIITTNGTLLQDKADVLIESSSLHKVNISLHSFEANNLSMTFDQYLSRCITFAKKAAGKKVIVFRLWNNGGTNQLNTDILHELKAAFPGQWVVGRRGTKIGNQIFLEYGDKFDWPDLTAQQREGRFFCYGLRDQLGILCDGTVVPCCLDHNGDIPLGNLIDCSLDDILRSSRAKAIYEGFSQGTAVEELCRRCGYAARFNR